MTDRELLELAAKAADMSISFHALFGFFDEIEERYWNPLVDDGDALRLAVKLGVCFGPNFDGDLAVCFGINGHNITETFGNDPYAATRRAIVRTAAEIGKKKYHG